ncbi:hypothetical protein JTB14_000652 [Gonioctena quinquepunctata]|nr:hypothetical protein JTB14_000652 [Gonioctena quinquepunctata]
MTDLSYNTDNILSNFPPCLRKNIEELCLRSKIGLSGVTLNDISIPTTGILDDDDILNNYHFIIKVPYAGKHLKWEILFDPEDFYFPPDFDFNDDDHFLAFPDLDDITNNIQAWKNWDLHNPQALSSVLNQFLDLYKKQQIEKLCSENVYARYRGEYESLLAHQKNITPKNIEVNVDGNSIVFFIAIAIDCSSLPEYIQPMDSHHETWYNPGEDYAHLKLTIFKLDGSRSNVSLQLSSRLEQILTKNRNFPLPELKKEMHFNEYVASVAILIENRIYLIAEHYKMKKIYVMTIAAACSRSIVEYDAETFNKAVFRYEVDDYDCLIMVTFGGKFPLDKPSVVLGSTYCQEGRMCNENLDKYPYNPTLKPEANIEHLLEYLHDAVLKFKCHKH